MKPFVIEVKPFGHASTFVQIMAYNIDHAKVKAAKCATRNAKFELSVEYVKVVTLCVG